MNGGATAGSSRAYRLDPHVLPARASVITGGSAEAAIIIDRERAIVRRQTATGRALTVVVPLNAYAGVALRAEPRGGPSGVRMFIELLHRDASLTLQLVVTDEPEDVAADWREWGRTLNLPLLVVAQDGSVIAPDATIGGLTVYPPKPRRRHSYFAARRPRFLTRRKPGRPSLHVIKGREITAPD
ncbi:MAG: DUF6101 family protein [Bauldia sp.]